MTVYRGLRKSARRGDLLDAWPSLAKGLSGLVASGHAYSAVMLGAKLAQVYTLVHLRRAGSAQRAQRRLLSEAFFLLRQELRAVQGFKSREPYLRISFREPLPFDCEAACDGSVRLKGAGAGFTLGIHRDGLSQTVEAALNLKCRTALEAELEAACVTLETAQCFGVRSIRLNTDSLGVVRGCEGRLPLKFCVAEDRLHRLLQGFAHAEVRLVPRLVTRHADRLAASVS